MAMMIAAASGEETLDQPSCRWHNPAVATSRCVDLGFPISSSGMARLVARNKYLFEDERKFYARGVSYGTFAPNSSGEPFPEPERVAQDFALMRELGANVVRTYEPPPPWMFEEAAKHGLRFMIGIPWPSHLAFLDSRDMTREIRETIRKAVANMRRFGDATFAYTLGNEIRSDIVRWHGARAIRRFLAELYDLGKQADPEGLFTYANYPSTEYLELNFLDFISFNVYLHREEDFRRYLTRLMTLAADCPLVLSETGMDTIREGDAAQASLLEWQTRAAFELGLSGIVVFAFTDEWFRGGAEITDWAFGLVTRDRQPKRAYSVVADVFHADLPPPLQSAPKASVVVAAYNAEATLGGCLDSLRNLNYPDYETIVVDDGSTDSTANIAESSGVRALRIEHRGLAAARNAGIDAATGDIVAFIDADARADSDWLYHLVATLANRRAEAAGGPNFAPPAASALAAAIAAAPGAPREVPAGDDVLAQLCGCNIAAAKAALGRVGGFDTMFTAAGDDVDLSWRLREVGATLAASPGAVVIHARRPTIGAYLAQQRSYGRGEGLLFRKHPHRTGAQDGMYGAPSWLSALFGLPRIYYGAMGRGLFQVIYPGNAPLALQIPLSVEWVGLSAILLIFGLVSHVLGVLGCLGFVATIAGAGVAAALSPLERGASDPLTRLILFALWILGPLARGYERERMRFRYEPAHDPAITAQENVLQRRGAIGFSCDGADGREPPSTKVLLESLRTALVRRGLAVAPADGFEPYDLQIIVAPAIRVPLNALNDGPGRVAIRWRLDVAMRPMLIAGAAVLAVLLLAGLPFAASMIVLALAALGVAAFGAARAVMIPAVMEAAANDVCGRLRLKLAAAEGGSR
jgi:GT2 family glycosyltransferase